MRRLAALAAVPTSVAFASALASAPLAAQTAPPAWKANCQVCHQADGAGLPGQFPRLSGRTATIAATPAGRSYLIAVVLNGLAGRITVDERAIVGVMPGFARLSDADVAAALNHAARGGAKGSAFKPAEIAAARATKTGNAAILAMRADLAATGRLP